MWFDENLQIVCMETEGNGTEAVFFSSADFNIYVIGNQVWVVGSVETPI